MRWKRDHLAISPERQHRLPRLWSNSELRKIGPLVNGDVLNVSAADDFDKEGTTYRDYFPNARSYRISNFAPGRDRGFRGREGEILLDLEAAPPDSLRHSFDLVLCHTTLEHIFDVRHAFDTVCSLSRDAVAVVVPFCQVQHENEGYQDFWRFTPTCLRRLFSEAGLEIVYEAANNDFNASVYIFSLAARSSEQWIGRLPERRRTNEVGSWIGAPPPRFRLPRMMNAVMLHIRQSIRRSSR